MYNSGIKARDLEFYKCEKKDIIPFVKSHHYTHSIHGVKIKYCFKAMYNNILVGAAIFGDMASKAWQKFSNNEKNVIELRRLVFTDEAGKNSESRFIGFCLRYLKKFDKSVKVVVSYADPMHGHDGTIYKASNFKFFGMSRSDYVLLDVETGKKFHSMALNDKRDNGVPWNYVKTIKERVEQGLIIRVKLPQKYCYVYYL